MTESAIQRLDHVNLRTARLDEMAIWYREMLGLAPGPRPDFSFPGSWLYAGGHAVIHLIGRDAPPTGTQEDLHLEHFAFSAKGLRTMLARFEAAGERTMLRRVPGFPVVQLNVWDPDGNHLHIDFDVAEADGLDLP